ncbi:uncharacterized protein LOC143276242 [Babylonia areolata]|uniref:uncharacterized protein LOC143276242 n=1 Tax=Babylonia areolata TaxID=304850 RepID=UPI003FD65094
MNTFIFLLALCPVVHTSSEPQKEALLFAQADKDGDGQLTEGDLQTIFLDFDTDGDSSISKAEFVADWRDVFHLGNSQQAETLFGRADTNDDGAITAADLPAIFAYFDMDGNNLVDLNEFLTQWGDLRLDAPDTVEIHLDNN